MICEHVAGPATCSQILLRGSPRGWVGLGGVAFDQDVGPVAPAGGAKPVEVGGQVATGVIRPALGAHDVHRVDGHRAVGELFGGPLLEAALEG